MHARLCGRSDPLGAPGNLAYYLADHAIILTNAPFIAWPNKLCRMEKKLKIRNAHSVLGPTASLMVLAGSLVASQRFKGGKSWAVALGGAAAAAAIDGLSNKEVVRCLGIPAKLNGIPG